MSATTNDPLTADWRGRLTGELAALFPPYAEKLAEAASRRALDADLCGHGLVTEADLTAAYHRVTGIPLAEDEEFQVVDRIPGIPADFLLQHLCLPWRHEEEGVLDVILADPYGIETLPYLFRRLHGCRTRFFLARRSHVERAIHAAYVNEPANGEDGLRLGLGEGDSEEALRTLASEAKIVRLVNEMFSRAVEMDASDIHVEPGERSLAIRFRVDGKLQEAMSPPLGDYPAIASRIKLVGGLNIAERRLPQDGRTDLQIGRGSLDVRISTVPTMHGESIVLRILRKDAVEFDLTHLGLNASMRRDFERLIQLPHGMILVVGPTGSGKSTTLYSVINHIDHRERKVITIEDPVEYQTEGIQQIQVNAKIGLDFASGLRHIVRQDPDVILVGEIRDRETAEIAIHAALTGHLVFSTLHTNDAPGAVSRLLDMGIESFLVSSALSGVLSQRLVRRLCKTCHGKGTVDGDRKCKTCAGRGFRGRIGIYELMTVNDELREAINARADSNALAQIAMRHGLRPLVEDGREKVAAGITTEAEVAGVAFNLL